MPDEDWERRLALAWESIEERSEEEFLATIDVLSAELRGGDPVAAFERASSLDSTGHPDEAAPLYREALANGLDGQRRRRATIQLASSLRNIGEAQESVELLTAEQYATSDDLDDAVRAFLALALTSVGRDREAASLALGALAPHLKRYNRSLAAYAQDLI
jgi:thioredoxin-like negative regulator of GroEL